MKKKVILLAAVLLAGTLAFAGTFKVGAEVGGNYSMLSTKTQFKDTTNSNTIYFDVLIPVEYEFSDSFSLASGLHWAMNRNRNVKTYAVGADTINVNDYMRTRHFLQVPVTARYYLNLDSVRLFAGAGGYMGVYLGIWQKGQTYDFNTDTVVESSGSSGPQSGDNLFTAGLLAELGLSGRLGPGDLYAVLRFAYGLTNLTKNRVDSVGIYYDNLTFSAGYTFRIGGTK